MASILDHYIGHGDHVQWLTQRHQQNQLPSTMIFQGPTGVGKKLLVRGFLQKLVCEKSQEKPCGVCSHCLRVLEEQNEMVFELGVDGKKNISVAQVRELHEALALKSMRGFRFVIIDPADRLSRQAANSLLKVLEESPEGTHFFLITDRVFGILPTIRSRAHILTFGRMTSAELEQKWGSLELLSWAGGRFDQAERLKEAETVEYLNKSIQLLYALVNDQPQDWKKKAPWFFSHEEWRRFCFFIWNQCLEKRLFKIDQDLDWLP
ncbi:MAG: hypothetical protein AAF203_07565 [Pseudomonadota bacterium]